MEFVDWRLGDKNNNWECAKDYLIVTDVQSKSNTQVGKFCGEYPPDPIGKSENLIFKNVYQVYTSTYIVFM